MKAAGFKVLWGTVLPRSDADAGDETRRLDYNNLLRANHAALADGLVDYAADPTIGPRGAAMNAAYYPDGVHPSTLGYGIMAGVAAPVINGLL